MAKELTITVSVVYFCLIGNRHVLVHFVIDGKDDWGLMELTKEALD